MYSQDQLDKSIREAVKRARREGLAGYLVLFIGILLVYLNSQDVSQNADDALRKETQRARSALVQSTRAVAVEGCNRDFRETKVLRTILRNGKKQIHSDRQRGEITVRQHVRRASFYDSQLDLLVLPDCREAYGLINDDPRIPVEIPKPKYRNGG